MEYDLSLHSWEKIDWNKLRNNILQIQVEIFASTTLGNFEKTQSLQRQLLTDPQAKLLATRRVTQDNRGRKTPGIDKIANIASKDRIDFALSLDINGSCSPIKRIYVPKPNGEKRLLGIPTIEDRAKQAVVKMALEPQWEAKFEGNSFGFRPGRSPKHATTAIYNSLFQKDKFVLDADIRKCFDRINHETLLQKVDSFPQMTNQIKSWLKAGIMDEINDTFTEENNLGTPQGSIISPVLCNIALHGIENTGLRVINELTGTKNFIKPQMRKAYKLIRYADDFVVLYPDLDVLLKIKESMAEFLKPLNLELHNEKTRVVHTRLVHENQDPGFSFLGYHFVHHTTKKHAQTTKYVPKGIGYVLRIDPQVEKIGKHVEKIKLAIKKHQAAPQLALIAHLNPIIRGWTNYYSNIPAGDAFSYCDHKMFWELYRWGLHRHPRKGKQWVAARYFHNYVKPGKKDADTFSIKKWVYAVKYENYLKYKLRYHTEQRFTFNTKLPQDYSPYHPKYRAKQIENYLTAFKSKLFKRQNGICRVCNGSILPDDLLEVHHLLPKSVPERNKLSMLWLIHGHCHDRVHSQEGIEMSIAEEEPYDA